MRKLKSQKNGPIEISPIEEDPEAVKISRPPAPAEIQPEPELPQEFIEIFSDEEYVDPRKKK